MTTLHIDCEQFTGRKKDICRGHDDEGNPIDLPEQKRQAYLQRWASQNPSSHTLPYTKRSWQGKSPCQHLGEVLRVVKCKPCQGTTTAQIRTCAIHGECTWRNGIRSRGMGGIPVTSCKFCDDYNPSPKEETEP